jgi:hypothetical protein
VHRPDAHAALPLLQEPSAFGTYYLAFDAQAFGVGDNDDAASAVKFTSRS